MFEPLSRQSSQRCAVIVLAAFLAVFTPQLAVAQERNEGESSEVEVEEEGRSRFAIAGFIGATREHGRNEPTIGFEGGVNITEKWSFGAVVERADRRRDSTLVLLGVGWHPLGPAFRLQLGIGRKDPSGNRESVIRTGVAYEIEMRNRWFWKPYFAVDFIENADDEEVFGVYFGKGFR